MTSEGLLFSALCNPSAAILPRYFRLFIERANPSNRVGYNNKATLASGNVTYAPSFVSIGSTGVNIADIIVDSGDEFVSGDVVIQTLNNDGTTKDSYYWFYNKNHGGSKGGTKGWYTDSDGAPETLITKESGIVFNAGVGFWVQGMGHKLVCSGQVLTTAEPIEIKTLASGNVMIANPYADAINIADIIVDSGDEFVSGDVVLQTLNNDGTTKDSYYWFYNKNHGGSKGGTKGWYTDSDGAPETLITKESGISLGVGEAYWAQGMGWTIKLPAFTIK